MPVFPSEAWCRAVIEAASSDPEAAAAARGWSGDVGVVVEAEGAWPAFVVWGRAGEAGVESWRVLADPAELDELRPAYVARASRSTWRGLLERRIDPVEAVLFRKLKVQGDAEQLLARTRFKGLAKRVLAAVETTFD